MSKPNKKQQDIEKNINQKDFFKDVDRILSFSDQVNNITENMSEKDLNKLEKNINSFKKDFQKKYKILFPKKDLDDKK
tara:strand:+ start:460 stop:693 length:234 start_codon:yes stop_codon:yes gene_type:complete